VKVVTFTIALVSIFLILGSVSVSEAILWDLIITAELEKNPLEAGEIPVIVGSVVDHASKPVVNAEVKLRFGINSATTYTDSTGYFKYESEQGAEPGHYIVNITATSEEGKMGMKSITYHVKGTVEPTAENLFGVYTVAPPFSISLSVEDMKKNPIAYKIFLHKLKLEQQLAEVKQSQAESNEFQLFIEEQRGIAAEKLEVDILKENPGSGIYSGWKLDTFLGKFDFNDPLKILFSTQLNYTLQKFDEARNAMLTVIENGGTWEEARQAYLEAASTSRAELEIINENLNENLNENTNSTNNEAP